jgi:hypothetical protein
MIKKKRTVNKWHKRCCVGIGSWNAKWPSKFTLYIHIWTHFPDDLGTVIDVVIYSKGKGNLHKGKGDF